MSPITNLKAQALSTPGPKQEIGWVFLEQDVNQGAGGDYIYLGYQTGTGTPVTDVNFFAASSSQRGPQAGWQYWDSTDLNKGAGGEYIYMQWNKGTNKSPVLCIMLDSTDQSTPRVIPGWEQVGVDLNKGAGGQYIWAYISRTISCPPSTN